MKCSANVKYAAHVKCSVNVKYRLRRRWNQLTNITRSEGTYHGEAISHRRYIAAEQYRGDGGASSFAILIGSG